MGFLPAQRNTDYETLKVYEMAEADAELATIADIEQASQDSGNWQNVTLIE